MDIQLHRIYYNKCRFKKQSGNTLGRMGNKRRTKFAFPAHLIASFLLFYRICVCNIEIFKTFSWYFNWALWIYEAIFISFYVIGEAIGMVFVSINYLITLILLLHQLFLGFNNTPYLTEHPVSDIPDQTQKNKRAMPSTNNFSSLRFLILPFQTTQILLIPSLITNLFILFFLTRSQEEKKKSSKTQNQTTTDFLT